MARAAARTPPKRASWILSSGVLVEKLGSEYHFYEMGADEAIVYLVAVLLRVSLPAPDEVSNLGMLASIGATPIGDGASAAVAPTPTPAIEIETRRLSEAYAEFTANFTLVPTKLIGTVSLSPPQTIPPQDA